MIHHLKLELNMLRILSVALVATFLFTTIVADDSNTTVPFAAFGAKNEDIGFALNIPSDGDDLFFTISGPSISSWLAIGMGGSTMKDSLIFMLYASSDRKNVTLSPRLSDGHSEPSHTSNVSISVLDGSGITSDGNMTVNARCSNCRSWKTGSINPEATKQKFIYGVGPDGSINSKSVTASVKAHVLYGSFTMDLTKAVGTGGVPNVGALFNSTVGTTQVTNKYYHDLAPGFHACIMIFAFLGMMPLGVLILRILNRPKWHGVHQTLSAGLAIFGAGFGIYIGTMYNRTKNFNSVHQIFGLLIIIALIAQFVLGFMHHRIYVRTQSPTKLAQPHVWLGRVIIPAGIINAFLGFPLNLRPHYNYILAGLVGLIIILILPFIYWKRERFMGSERHKVTPEILVESSGYQSRPWATDSMRSDIHLNNMQHQYPPAYDQRYA